MQTFENIVMLLKSSHKQHLLLWKKSRKSFSLEKLHDGLLLLYLCKMLFIQTFINFRKSFSLFQCSTTSQILKLFFYSYVDDDKRFRTSSRSLFFGWFITIRIFLLAAMKVLCILVYHDPYCLVIYICKRSHEWNRAINADKHKECS